MFQESSSVKRFADYSVSTPLHRAVTILSTMGVLGLFVLVSVGEQKQTNAVVEADAVSWAYSGTRAVESSGKSNLKDDASDVISGLLPRSKAPKDEEPKKEAKEPVTTDASAALLPSIALLSFAVLAVVL
eukprot:NODE_2492_length_529_cov_175.841667_g1979_i0.p1 GENE.NODE_2492_length_529_cov_175.841667_g1979_i0~~NODE_2492_length_529_cov_175.841667_g1979_i0.p1  ORF type:complete len:150 (+),score=51.70 NODE_2492_length_529_cov_175.841667_g1979_i0:63-452(+)